MSRALSNKMMGTFRGIFLFFIVTVLLTLSHSAGAKETIVILDFELNDITSLPNTPNELTRTASLKPLLEQAISSGMEFEIVEIDPKAQQSANAGFGYLFRFPDEAAKLGKQWGAGWIIVGQYSKPSFLESSLIVNVVKVNTGRQVAEIIIDLKGNHAKVTERASKELAKKIETALSVRKKNRRLN